MLRKFFAVAIIFAVSLVSATVPALAGDYHYQHQQNQNDIAAGMAAGFIFGLVTGVLANQNQPRTVYVPVRPAPSWQHGGQYDPYSTTRRCPDLGHYQGRLIYRNGCYYPG